MSFFDSFNIGFFFIVSVWANAKIQEGLESPHHDQNSMKRWDFYNHIIFFSKIHIYQILLLHYILSYSFTYK